MSIPSDNLRDELLRIRAEYGGELTAEAIVASATSASSPLHDEFLWDDSEAAHQYRLNQARRLVKYVKEPYIRPTGEQSRVRYFHAIQDDNRTVYSPLSEVVQDPVATAILLKQAEREWRTLWGRYQHLSEFVDIVRGAVKVTEPTEE